MSNFCIGSSKKCHYLHQYACLMNNLFAYSFNGKLLIHSIIKNLLNDKNKYWFKASVFISKCRRETRKYTNIVGKCSMLKADMDCYGTTYNRYLILSEE